MSSSSIRTTRTITAMPPTPDCSCSFPCTAAILCLLALLMLVIIAYDILRTFEFARYVLTNPHPSPKASPLPDQSEIMSNLKPYSGPINDKEVCAFCKGHHTCPVQLPCRHIYCPDCVQALVEHSLNRRGLCNREYFCFATAELEEEAEKRHALVVMVYSWLVTTTCMIAVCFAGLILALPLISASVIATTASGAERLNLDTKEDALYEAARAAMPVVITYVAQAWNLGRVAGFLDRIRDLLRDEDWDEMKITKVERVMHIGGSCAMVYITASVLWEFVM